MNDREFETQLQRLTDGELSGDQYRRLLASLDDEPAGWRRCALAFLETQALGQDLPLVRRSLETTTATATPPPVQPAPSRSLSHVSWLAIAASFLFAFSLGLIAPRFFTPQFFTEQMQDSFATGNFPSSAAKQPFENVTTLRPASFDPQSLRNIGNLQLVVDNAEPDQVRQVPVYETGSNFDAALTSSFQGAVPPIGPELIDLLRGHGYDVRHEQQYVPATLEDGRQMIVPLDGYQITPVSRRY